MKSEEKENGNRVSQEEELFQEILDIKNDIKTLHSEREKSKGLFEDYKKKIEELKD